MELVESRRGVERFCGRCGTPWKSRTCPVGIWLPKPATSWFPHRRRSLRELWSRNVAPGLPRTPANPPAGN